ncbi:MAG: hypothetical protein KZQ89_08590 [Candidatus Thiodiazotropha sp. (ex Lucinoma kastoroae)]|nr:hypothetical protein [Candidatus Thiodiazotropha sp. (ex Lucinoma kastoroae)]MCU7859269.1 hypothetical protein [Candidatus Thiodiazotropha sp. (ex Lucinoma kastoroae)]
MLRINGKSACTDHKKMSVHSDSDAVTSPYPSILLDEQVWMLYAQAPLAMVTGLLIASLIVLTLWDQVVPLQIGVWLGSLIIITLARLRWCKPTIVSSWMIHRVFVGKRGLYWAH